MEAELASTNHPPGVFHQMLLVLGPTLVISLGYVDPGKWASTIDGGAHFGFGLVLPMFTFNVAAILCQYLSARIGVVTGKDLTQICSNEYSKFMCMSLGIQSSVSMMALDLTVILGIAHGLNLLFGVDLSTCVLLTAVDAVVSPLFSTFLEKRKANFFFTRVSFALFVLYVLGVLVSQPEISLTTNWMRPKLGDESLFALMSLLGANIMPHNFYLHSSMVLQHQGLSAVSKNALCHIHFCAICSIFCFIFMVNLVLLNSAANVFYSSGLIPLTFFEALSLPELVLRSPVAQIAFVLVLYLTNQITTLTWNLGGQVVLYDFVTLGMPNWLQRTTVRIIAIIPVLYCLWTCGVEGVYQLLIFTQVVIALQLPSSVIPLFRVASSRKIMGIIFVTEMIFGDSDWVGNLRWNMGMGSSVPYITLLMTAFSSFCMMLWLAATPLKSATRVDAQVWNWNAQIPIHEPSLHREGIILGDSRYDGKEHFSKQDQFLISEKSIDSCPDESITKPGPDLPETSMESGQELHQTTTEDNYSHGTFSSAQICYQEDHAPAEESLSVLTVGNDASDADLVDPKKLKVEPIDTVEKTVVVEGDLHVEKKDDEANAWEPDEFPKGVPGSTSSLTFDGPASLRSLSGKSDEGGNDAGSLSRLGGLGRAARRQFAAILEAFWGQLYNNHGQSTPDAKAKKWDVLMADSNLASFLLKVETIGKDVGGCFPSVGDIGSDSMVSSSLCDPARQPRMQNHIDSSYGIQSGSSSMWFNHMQLLDPYVHGSSHNVLDSFEKTYSSMRTLPSTNGWDIPRAMAGGSVHNVLDSTEKRYSSMRTQPSSDIWVTQPATIHGYQIGSIANQIAKDRGSNCLNGQLESAALISSSLGPQNYKDPYAAALALKLQNGLNSPQASQFTASRNSLLQPERAYYDPCLSGFVDNGCRPVNTKKYHSLPDIPGLAGPYAGLYMPEKSTKWESSVGRTSYELSLYANTGLGMDPLAFDGLSGGYGNGSLWSKQPFEQFGVGDKSCDVGRGVGRWSNSAAREGTCLMDSEAQLLCSFRDCIIKLLKLEGSDWLFRQNDGADEDLINHVATREKYFYEAEMRDMNLSGSSKNDNTGSGIMSVTSVPNCGEDCVWGVDLIVSFGVWCIHRILDLSVMEGRPELWGKYTYVLNSLQGIIDPAFSKPRRPLSPCFCLQVSPAYQNRSALPVSNGMLPPTAKPGRGKCTTSGMLLDLIKDVELAISCRKGRSGTTAGDVAFPKGKENIASVLKRYKRRLSNKPSGGN
ncbi:hypothetical protein K2173_019363 [Erythroxylum novogranatense]|uniref:Ethylene-insensitive protein 2 n=1 Tax=Erythroxylum novogranatense TaxID=1862640 RepID=A0AAV8UFS5_9ROSI|nr:hypothetical protein K2173_019363 [Erythroxylum novogranatense]